MSSNAPQQHYSIAFEHALIGGLRQSLARIQASGGLPSEQDRLQAWHVLEFALERTSLWPEAKPVLLTLTPCMEQAGLRADWLPYLHAGIEVSRDVGDRAAEGELRIHAGWFQGQLGQLDAARSALQSAQTLLRTLDEPALLARALNRLALIERRCRRPRQAEALADEALTYLAGDDPERANCYVVLGELAMDRREWPQTEEYARRAYRIWSNAGDRRRAAWALRNLSPALFEQGKQEEAIHALLEAEAILRDEHDPVQLAVTRMNLGNVHRLTGDVPAAIALYNQAERTLRVAGDEVGLAMLYLNRGSAYGQVREWSAGERDLKTSIVLWAKMENLQSRLNAIDELALLYHAQGDGVRALETAAEGLDLAAAAQRSGSGDFTHITRLLTSHLERFSAGDHPV